MKKIILILLAPLLIAAAFMMGMHEGDCTGAVVLAMLTVPGMIGGV